MTTWTTIPDSNLDVDKPARSIDALALRDNPVAITEGASGAPRIQAQALRDFIVGDTVAVRSGEKSTQSLTYVKAYEVRANRAGELKTTLRLRSSQSPGVAYARIYINGVAAGIQRSTTSETFVTYDENITFNKYDLIQLYIRRDSAAFTFSAVASLELKADDSCVFESFLESI